VTGVNDTVEGSERYLWVEGEPLELKHVLLLGHPDKPGALRYGDGPVELTAERAGDGVRLHVLDRGPGFDPALNGRAFERFTRGDRARSRGGTGLGLAIVDAIARSHGRAAGAAARDGGGADVWIELPIVKGSDPLTIAQLP